MVFTTSILLIGLSPLVLLGAFCFIHKALLKDLL